MMKRKFFYDSVEDSQRRLSSTVVQFDGDPVMIHSIQGLNTDQIATVFHLPYSRVDGNHFSAPLIPSRFQIRDLPGLGYVDYKDFSYYTMRIPSRQGKQGYCRSNVQILQNPNGGTPTWEMLLATKEFRGMLTGKYKRFGDVFDSVISSDTPVKRSFSKTMSLEIDDMESVSLEHRGMKVAVANNPKKSGPVFRLLNKFRYLTEELSEYGVKVE